MEQMKLSIELDDAARQWLVDKVMILNMVQDQLPVQSRMRVEDVLAERILMGKVHAGNKVKISAPVMA